MPWPKLLTAVDMPSLAPWRKARTQHIWDSGWEQMVFIQEHDCFLTWFDLFEDIIADKWKSKWWVFASAHISIHFHGMRFRFLCNPNQSWTESVTSLEPGSAFPTYTLQWFQPAICAKKNTNNHVPGCKISKRENISKAWNSLAKLVYQRPCCNFPLHRNWVLVIWSNLISGISLIWIYYGFTMDLLWIYIYTGYLLHLSLYIYVCIYIITWQKK